MASVSFTNEVAASRGSELSPQPYGELKKTLILAAAFLLVFLAHYVSRPAVEAILVKRFGATNVPLAALVRDVFALPVTLVVLASHRRSFQLSKAIISIVVPCCALLIVVPFLPNPAGYSLIAFFLYLASGILVNTGQYCTWMLFTSSVITRNWLYFTIFGCGPQIAVIVSSTLARQIIAGWGVEKLLWVGCAVYIATWIVIIYAVRRFACFGGRPEEIVGQSSEFDDKQLSFRALGALLVVPYTRFLCLAIFLQVVTGEALRWKIFQQADKTSSLAGAAELLSKFFQQTGFISLSIQLLIVPLLFLFLVRRGLMIQPLLGLVVVMLLTENASALLVVLAVATYISFEYTVNNCMREVLYIPLPLSLKVRMKAALAILIPNIAHLVGSAVVFALTIFTGVAWQVAVAAISCFWLWSAWRVTRLYKRIATTELSETAVAADAV